MSSVHDVARQVRDLIERAGVASTEPIRISAGACKVASSCLFVLLKELGFTVRLVQGHVLCDGPDPDAPTFIRAAGHKEAVHYWVVVDGLIVDVSADQFNGRLAQADFDEIVIAPEDQLVRHIPAKDCEPFIPDDGDWLNAMLVAKDTRWPKA